MKKHSVRKFLAGLLSLGMLLQAAAPLSAMAAESAEPSIVLKMNGTTRTFTPAGDSFTDNNYPVEVTYEDNTYTISGVLNGTLGDEIAITGIAGTDGQKPNVVLDGNVAFGNNFNMLVGCAVVDGVNNFTLKSPSAGCSGSAELTCDGDILIETGNSGAIYSYFTVHRAASVTVKSNGIYPTLHGTSTIENCSGDVTIINSGDGSALARKLTVDTDGKVTVIGKNSGYSTSFDSNLLPEGTSISASGLELKNTDENGSIGQVELIPKNAGSGLLVNGELVEVKDGKLILDGDALQNLTITSTNSNPNTPSDDNTGNDNTGNDDTGSADTPSEPDTGSDSSGDDIGEGIMVVALGGAAIWGGYELVTRAILHELLPEGAAIPASRGELALLLWNTAGQPEPAAQPAFADVTDASLAQAAQWCTEQGLLEARADGSFDADGWMPKFRVIESWRAAFPAQN